MVKTGENSWFFTNPLTKGQFKKQFALLVYRDDRPNHWYFFQRLKDGNWQIQEIVQDAIKSGSLYTADNAYKEYMKLRKTPWDCLYNADATTEWNKRSKSLWRGVRGRPKEISKTAGTKKPTGYTKKVAGEFMKAVPIHGIRPMKKPATAKNTSASKKNTTSTSSKKPTARKTIKGKEGYSLIEKKKKGYCVPETKQTYWKRL